ncbi:MAG: acyl-CoA dehydrogenase family protein, partial [Acidimicrobiales bacterium]
PESITADLRAWLADAWDPQVSLVEWRRRLAGAGWAAPSWPSGWHGRGWPAWTEGVVAAALAAAGAVGTAPGVGMMLAAPTILEHGPDRLRERFLWPILTGEETWCQLFSEPGAGSDLAGLTTTAVRDGEEWVVHGQKVWNTSAHHADFGLLVARTDWDAPKHKGLTYLVIPMHQAGVMVRPLRQMNGHASFNEVFLTDARVPSGHVIGSVGDGWQVARTTLAHERRFGAMHGSSATRAPGRVQDEARAEADEHFAPYVWYPQRAGRVDLLAERAAATGTAPDPVVRQRVTRAIALHKVSAWTAERARAVRAAGLQPGPEGSIGKLAMSEVARTASAAHSAIAGASAMLAGADAPLDGVVTEVLVSVPAQSIAGGTDEIQHNILGENILGLPREPGPGRDTPFRQVPRNT